MAFKTKRENWQNKKRRIKSGLKIGSYPRLVVFRSNTNIYAQIVDDTSRVTLASASSIDKDLKGSIKSAGSKTERSALVGKAIGEAAVGKDIKQVIFDRNGYVYHGRVKALANAAREAGLKF